MKKVILVVLLFAGLSTLFAQRDGRHPKKEFFKELSASQLATLHTKKMTLALDLTKQQQQQVMELHLANAEFRKSKMEEREANREAGKNTRPTAEERFKLESERLDRKIAQQERLKQILNDDQYQLWKRLAVHKHHQGKKRMQRAERKG